MATLTKRMYRLAPPLTGIGMAGLLAAGILFDPPPAPIEPAVRQQKQAAVEREIAALPAPPGAVLVEQAARPTETGAFVERRYRLARGYRRLRAYWDGEFVAQDWTLRAEDMARDWFGNLGGWSRATYCRGDLEARLDYDEIAAGDVEDAGSHTVTVSWGPYSKCR
jgi:hypothetical protein